MCTKYPDTGACKHVTEPMGIVVQTHSSYGNCTYVSSRTPSPSILDTHELGSCKRKCTMAGRERIAV